ncbi:MAG TPA: cytochrome c3 family protein [Thermoanaerobaculia bacterium]|nr:cytochrome c3 family protein [Thermoanaerobaculia bacterium]
MFVSLGNRRLFVMLLAAALALPASGGEWHYGVSLVCSDCHTQHNSENGQPMRTDNNPTPAPLLLRRGTPLELCLSCHDGSNPAAPDVIAPVSYVSEPAGGAFPDAGGQPVDPAMSYGHHLNTPSPVIPPGGTLPMVLVCTTCHDPHGNTNYRNLRTDPTKTNGAPLVVVASQPVVADGSNPSQVYVSSNIVYKSGISAWCSRCHGTPYPHSVDRPMWGSANASYTAWSSVTNPRVPVSSPTDDTIPSHDDQVMCLSCHKAHASNNRKALIYADGATLESTCQECHDQ